MNDPSFASGEAKVYRMNLAYRIYHFVVGAAALVGAILCHQFLILSVGLALLSVFHDISPGCNISYRRPVFRYSQEYVLEEFVAAFLDYSG